MRMMKLSVGRESPSESAGVGDVRVERLWYRHCCKICSFSESSVEREALTCSRAIGKSRSIPEACENNKTKKLLALTMRYICT